LGIFRHNKLAIMCTVSGRTAIKILIHLYDTKNQDYALITYSEHTQLKTVQEGI
jgi:hypothetical protein